MTFSKEKKKEIIPLRNFETHTAICSHILRERIYRSLMEFDINSVITLAHERLNVIFKFLPVV